VIAMQFEIEGQHGIAFAETFYTYLVERKSPFSSAGAHAGWSEGKSITWEMDFYPVLYSGAWMVKSS
jgi:hypothetical protein